LVLTQPDRPAGRGLRVSESAVAEAARAHALPLHQPQTLRDLEARARIAAEHPDVMVVAAYGLLLPVEALAIPPRGCLNIHASLLPRWRGAAPIQRAILAGDARTGITIMRMDAGLDTGPMLLQRDIPIGAHDTTVRGNQVNGNTNANPSITSGGILVQKLSPTGTAPVNDVIRENKAFSNKPFDVSWDQTGTVQFKKNHCSTSSPAGLCTKAKG